MSDRPPYERRDQDAVGASRGASNGTGVGALVVGIIALVLSVLFFPLGILLGIVALVLGVVGRNKAARGDATNGGMAVAGIVTGAIAIVIGVLIAIFVGSFIADNADEIDDLAECLEQADTDQEAEECAAQFEDEVVPDDGEAAE